MSDIPSANKSSRVILQINQAAKLLGVSKDTLRRWEKAGKISTQRNDSGYRLYDITDLISQIKSQKIIGRVTKTLPGLELITPEPAPKDPKKLLKISEAAQALGLSKDTLRRWEAAGKLKAERTEAGYRLYDISTILETQRPKIKKPAPQIYKTVSENIKQNINLSSDRPILNASPISYISPQDLNTLNYQSLPIPVPIPVPSPVITNIKSKPNHNYFTTFALIALCLSVIGISGITLSFFNKQTQNVSIAQNLTPKSNPLDRQGQVLAESTPSASFLEINLDTKVNGLLDTSTLHVGSTAAVDGPLTLNTVEYTFPNTQGAQNTFLQNNGQGSLSWTSVPLPPAATNTTLGIASFSSSNFTVTGGAVSITNGSITGSQIGSGTITNSNLSSSKITINTGSGLTGGGDVSLGGSITISSTGNSGVTSITGTPDQVIASASTGDVTLSLPQSIALTSSPEFANLTISDLDANGVVYTTGTGTLDTATTGLTGECLLSNGAGAPTWGPCFSGSTSFTIAGDSGPNQNIGSGDTLTVNGDANIATAGVNTDGFSISLSSALTGINSIDTIAVSATGLTFAGAGTISSTTSSPITIDSGTTGTVNLGTGNNAKTINLGTGTAGNIINLGTNNTTADSINIGSALDTTVITGTTRIAGLTTDGVVYTSGGNGTLNSEAQLSVGRGGTGVSSFGGTNTILYTTSANTLASIPTGNNGVLVTSAGGAPSISSTLPNAVQDNITRTGTIVSGVWNGTIIDTEFGGTGQDFSGATQGSLAYFSATGTMAALAPSTAGYVLVTQGPGADPQWVDAGGLGVRWNNLQDPNGNQSLSMTTFTTAWNWATGTSSDNLFNLTTDASANGTGSLLNIQTGISSTVLPLRVRAGSVEGLMVSASGNVGIGTTSPASALEVIGSVRISGLTASSGVYTDSNKQLTSTPPTSGILGYWTRAGSTLSPANGSDDLSISGTSTFSGDIIFNAATPTIVLNNTETISITDGSNTLLSLADGGTTGNLVVTGTINSNTLSSTALTFSGSNPVISASTAATSISLNPGAGGLVNLAGGSGSTGCTIDDTTGDFTCAGDIVGGGGDQGFWSRAGNTLSPSNTGDNITTTGNISTTGTGTITSAGTLTAQNGLTLTTGNLSMTSTSGSVALTLTSSVTAFNINSGVFDIDTSNSRVGIGTIAPNNSLEVRSTTTPQVRAAYDTSNYVTLGVTSIGLTTLSVTGSSPSLNLQVDGTTNVNIAGGSGATGCTVTNSTGDLTCSGNITGGSSGTAGFWSRNNSTSTLSPATANDKVLIATTNTSNADLALTNTGVYTGTGIFNLTANSATTGNLLSLTGTGLTTGEVLNIDSTHSPASGTNEAIDINITHSPSGVDNFRGIDLSIADATAFDNVILGVNSALTLSGNANKVGRAISGSVTSSSTTADSLNAGHFSTSATGNSSRTGNNALVGSASTSSTTADNLSAIYAITSSTGILTTGTRNNYGYVAQPASTAASTGGTNNISGLYANPSSTLSNPGVSDTATNSVFGVNIQTVLTIAADCGSNCVSNQYGLYVNDGTSSTNGTSTKYGIYVAPQTGADANYGAYFGSNVGIGNAAPSATLYVAKTSSTSTLTGTSQDGIFSNYVANPGNTTTSAIFDSIVGNIATTANGINQTGTNIRGLVGVASYGGNNTLGGATGVASSFGWNSSGTISSAYGFHSTIGTNNGTITNTYGVYIGNVTSGTQTNTPYGLFQSDTGAKNYFAGNVGIGTTAPAGLLEVNGAVSSANLIRGNVSSATTTLSTDYGTLSLVNTNSTANNYNAITFSDDGGSLASGIYGIYTDHTNNYGDLAFVTRAATIGYTEKLRITGAGNVGIGTTAPDNPLEVRKDQAAGTYIRVNNQQSPTSGIYSGIRLSINSTASDAYLRYDGSNNNMLELSNSGSNGPIRFVSGGGEALRILTGGNVGIGDTTPDALLDLDFSTVGSPAFGITDTGVHTGTTTNSLINIASNSTATGTVLYLSATGLTTGRALDIVSSTDPAGAGAGGVPIVMTTTNLSSVASTVVGTDIRFSQNPSVSGNTEIAFRVVNLATTDTDDTTVSSLIRVDNADTSATGSTVVANGIEIRNTGGISGGMTNGITIGSGTESITTGINLASTGITTDLNLQNGETVDNDTNNQINLGLGASGTLLLTSTSTSTIANSAGALAINAAATGLNLQADGSIDVNIAGGSSATGCTVANSTGNLTCTGNITGASTGTAGYWSRSSTTLSPATANDIVSLSTNSTTASNKALSVAQTGATSGTDYAGYFSNTGAATTNVGLYATATGATNNYAAIFEAGNVGIGTIAPGAQLGVSSSSQVGIQSIYTGASSSSAGAGLQLVSNDGAAMASGDRIGAYFIAGATDASSTLASSAAISAFATEAWSGSAAGTSLQFETMSTGSISRTTKMIIDGSGNVGIGTTAPSQLFAVGTGGTSNFTVTSAGNTVINGTTTLGDATSDDIVFNGYVASSILPKTDDTYDLGDNTHRFRDLYLAGDTLHLGTSTTDEGTISYNTSSNIFSFGTDSTTNADIAFFTDDLYLDKSSGNIGIGLINPASLLNLQQSTTGNVGILINNSNSGSTTSTGSLEFGQASVGGGRIVSGRLGAYTNSGNSNSYMAFSTAIAGTDGEKMRISGANVGIGITAPVALLQTYGAGQATTTPTFTASTSGNQGGTLFVSDSATSAGNGGMLMLGNSNGSSNWGYAAIKAYFTDGNNNGAGDMLFLTRNTTAATTLTERMRILSTGNIGIGTAAPAANLHISAANALEYITHTTTSSFGGLHFFETSTLRGGMQMIGSAFGTASRQNDLELFTTSGDFTVDTSNDGINFSIASNGNVGIGTTAPTAKLELNDSNTSGSTAASIAKSGAYTIGNFGLVVGNSSTSSTASINRHGAYVFSTGTWNGTTANSIGLLIQASGGTQNLPIYDNISGALLSSAGIWTNAPSWRATKKDINPINPEETQEFYNWLLNYQPVTYLYKDKTVQNPDGTTGQWTDTSINHHTGFLLDDMPESLRRHVIGSSTGGISTADLAGTTLILLQENARRTAALNQKVENALLTINQNGTADLNVNKITVASDVKVGGLVSASNFALDASVLNRTGSLASVPVNNNKVTVADALNSLSNHQSLIINQVSGLAAQQTSQAADLAEAKILGEQAVAHAETLDDKVASTSANLSSLSSRIDELLASISGQDNQASNSPTPNSQLPIPNNLDDLTPPDMLIATDSATFADLNITNSLSTLDATVSGTLKSLGDTFLGNTTIAGDLSVDGTMSFTDGNSINAFPILFLQNNPLAEKIDLFNGAITLDKTGLLSLKKLAVSGETLGTAVISSSQTKVTVSSVALTEKSKVFVSTEKPVSVGVTNKNIGSHSFELEIAVPTLEDLKVDWWIVDQE